MNSGSSHCSAAGEVVSEITMDNIQAAMQEARDLMPDDVPDVYVMTTDAERKLRDYIESQDNKPLGDPMTREELEFFGLPFESYPTLKECFERCLELKKQGKSVALVGQ